MGETRTRVDDETAGQRLGGTRKFRQDQRSVSLMLAGNILVGDLIKVSFVYLLRLS